MAETYDIKFDDSSVGTARVEKLGLYYVFSCRCRLPDEGLYRIHVICGESRQDLGICVPVDGTFGMDKKIPAKYLGEGDISFKLLDKDWKPPIVEQKPLPEEKVADTEVILPEPEKELILNEQKTETFVPVSEDEPFEYLDKLEHAVMEVRDEQVGIVLPMQE